MRKLIQEGYIGEVTACEARVQCGTLLKEKYNWMCDDYMGGGVLNIHGGIIVDLITFLTSQRAIKVHAMLKTFTRQTEEIKGIRFINSDDFCSLQMELNKCACVVVTLNTHVHTQFVHEVLVCGTKGRLVARNDNLYGQKHDESKEEILHENNCTQSDSCVKIVSTVAIAIYKYIYVVHTFLLFICICFQLLQPVTYVV